MATDGDGWLLGERTESGLVSLSVAISGLCPRDRNSSIHLKIRIRNEQSLSDTVTTPVTPADEPAIEENPEATPAAAADTGFGTFDEEGNYTPREITSDDLGMSFADAIAGTMVESRRRP